MLLNEPYQNIHSNSQARVCGPSDIDSHLNYKATVHPFESLIPVVNHKQKKIGNVLELLTTCPHCHQEFRQPTTLSCGFTLCAGCIPADNHQCLSFTCLRAHSEPYQPNVILQEILSSYTSPNFHHMMDKVLECCICYNTLTDPVTSQCGHTFCKQCLVDTLVNARYKSCPICRQTLVRIGKTNQLLSDWMKFIKDPSFKYQYKNDPLPIIQLSSNVVFPSLTYYIHITNDTNSVFDNLAPNLHQSHHALCIPQEGSQPGEYGTMVQIVHLERLPDLSHSVVQVVGLFRVKLSKLSRTEYGSYLGSVARWDDTLIKTSCSEEIIDRPSLVKMNIPSQPPNKRPRPSSMISFSPNSCRLLVKPPTAPSTRKVWAQSWICAPSRSSFEYTYYSFVWNKLKRSQGRSSVEKNKRIRVLLDTASVKDLYDDYLLPLLQQFTRFDHELIKRYEWCTQQEESMDVTLWWVANTLPFNEKIHILKSQSLSDRMLTILCWYHFCL
ncbi:hypothetical protein BDB01DRAFT_894328 [Pilobolus umbonatus]|nr:hypothetical protein BDB01DRAFT_894328 [Pilobolus umbonatus]